MKISISIVIPVYNAGQYLADAIQSIDDNLIPEFRVDMILVDDCSTDSRTIEILSFLQERPDITVIRQSKNGGPSAARNAGIRAAKGDWIGFLDADDLMLPTALSRRFELICSYPEAKWIAGDYLEMLSEGVMTKNDKHEISSFFSTNNTNICPIDVSVRLIVESRPILFGCMIIRKDLLSNAGYINANLIYAEDWYYSLVLAHLGDLYWLPTPVICLRRHHESLTKDVFRSATENYKSALVAVRDPRFKGVRYLIKWRLAGALRFGALTLIQMDKPQDALRLALTACYWTPTDLRCMNLVFASILALLKHFLKPHQSS